MIFGVKDIGHMQEALALAAQGKYSTSPNPAVGCVIVKDGRVVGKGFHRLAGEDHAEVLAIKDAGELTKESTAYVTLEPCNHQGRTGPCADALISAGISRVVYACGDANPKVSGNGHQALQAAGIDTVSGVCEEEAFELNRGYFKRMTEGKPYVRLKMAMSLDGAMAMSSGESKWITSDAARSDGQRLRASSCAVMTGIGTVLADDPLLNVREKKLETHGREVTRIVLDTHLRCSASANIFTVGGQVLIFCGESFDVKRHAELTKVAEIEIVKETSGILDLKHILSTCASYGLSNLLIEAGPTLTRQFIERKLLDELVLYIAPKIIGTSGKRAFQISSPETLSKVLGLRFKSLAPLGDDIVLTLVPNA
jgi:diaminohydroxyphosphoribosylaminopyrimidine deaminase / 5-amino-6-(5-phosphoribosylamino)uracil reductase